MSDPQNIILQLSDEEIQSTLNRRQAKDDLIAYNKILWPEEMPAAHHRLILSALKEVADGTCKRLLIMAPPGSAKSAYCSIRFPSWFRGKYPKLDIIASSHTQELADKFGRRVRNICQSEDWQGIFGTPVSQDSTAVNRWTMSAGGEWFSVGVGGLLPGRRASLVVLDDAAGGIEDAINSRITRERVWDWYNGDVLPRLKPDARQIVVGTRFHSEDFIGKLMQLHEAGIEEWKIIDLPWSAGENDPLGRKPGERLWAEYFTQEMEDRARRNLDTWMALYQQKPIIESGSYFKREWIHEYDVAPKNLRIYGASDYAVTMGGGDYTVHLVCGVSEDGLIYLLDCWRAQETTDVWVDALINLMKRWKPLEWFEEKGQIAKGMDPIIKKTMREAVAHVHRTQYSMPRGDGATLSSKQVGAQSIRGRLAQGMVYFPKGAFWMPDLLAEMMAFPTEKSGVHDDFVDSLSLLGRGLDSMVNATRKRDKKPVEWQTPAKVTFGELVKQAARKRLESEW